MNYNSNLKLEYIIEEDSNYKKLHKVLSQKLKLSSKEIKYSKYSNSIFIDKKNVHTNFIVRTGQLLTVILDETRNYPCIPCNLDLDVKYENEHIIILNKPAPLATVFYSIDTGDTLQNAVYSYFNCPNNFVYRPINRLDKGTSGLMLIAKNYYIQHLLQEKLHSEDYVRTYIAICDGIPIKKEDIICNKLSHKTKTTYMVSNEGKQCKTAYKVLDTFKNYSLLKLKLYTGRTHQIRVQLANMGCPLVGDYIYGKENEYFKHRFALHSNYLKIISPLNNKKIICNADVPDCFERFLKSANL